MNQEFLDKFQSHPSLSSFDRLLFTSSRNLLEKHLIEANETTSDKKELEKLAVKLFTTICFESKLKLFNQTFAGITTEGAKLLIPKVEAPSDSAEVPSWSAAVYGEVEFASFVNIMQRCCYTSSSLSSNHYDHEKKGKVFVDLGHGLGKAMVATSLLFGPQFSHIYGIEYAEPLYKESVSRLDRYKEIMSSSGYIVPHEIISIFGDFLQLPEEKSHFDWTTADIVFANSTCFGYELMKQIAILAEKMSSGTFFISLTFSLPSTSFEIIDQRNYAMSWGLATCYIHRRK